jgi:hypothetical protein
MICRAILGAVGWWSFIQKSETEFWPWRFDSRRSSCVYFKSSQELKKMYYYFAATGVSLMRRRLYRRRLPF